MAEKTIFKRIIDREIPAKIVYEDEHCLAFEDIHPVAPTHLVVIPKREIASVDDVSRGRRTGGGPPVRGDAGDRRQMGLDNGYRVVTNCGRDAGQEVMHLHFHMLAGRRFGWPPG